METKKLSSEEVINDLKCYLQKTNGFVVMFGKAGRGKSFAAMKIYECYTPHKLPFFDVDCAWFITQSDLNTLYNLEMREYGHCQNLQYKACSTRMLVLDDLGTRIPTPGYMDFLYAIIDHRWIARDKKVTIITTNLDSATIRKEFGDRILSRIASGKNYEFTGPDRRLTETCF